MLGDDSGCVAHGKCMSSRWKDGVRLYYGLELADGNTGWYMRPLKWFGAGLAGTEEPGCV